MKKTIIIMMLCATTLLGCPSPKSEFTINNANDTYEKSKISGMHPSIVYLLAQVDEMTKPDLKNPNLALSSNPYDYIAAHKDIYDELVAGGQSTVDIFVDILTNSNEFGLDKYIMAAVCAQITGIGNGSDKTWASAKDWLILYEKTNNAVPDNTSGVSNSNSAATDANETDSAAADAQLMT